MDYMTIREASVRFQISARMLRYYEKAGLIESTRREEYAYRIYDENAVRKIQQIIVLRKLQIPLKQIQCMMNGNKEEAIRILEKRLHDMDEGAAAIHAMKSGLERLLTLLREDFADKSYMDFAQDHMITELTGFLPLEKHHFNEKMSMDKEMVDKGRCVRILLLPPCTVAAYQFTGNSPEEVVGEVMDAFIRSSKLYEKKPDARLFGFNNPAPRQGSDEHGYEDWVTIPDDMEVPAPLEKKYFNGGLYAAYTINFPDFYEWNVLVEWIKNNETYQADDHDGADEDMDGCMEEHLNWVYSSHMGWPENGIDGQIDLLMPIKKRGEKND